MHQHVDWAMPTLVMEVVENPSMWLRFRWLRFRVTGNWKVSLLLLRGLEVFKEATVSPEILVSCKKKKVLNIGTWDVKNPMKNGILSISTGAGFLPSRVSLIQFGVIFWEYGLYIPSGFFDRNIDSLKR